MNKLAYCADWFKRNWRFLKWPVAALLLTYLFYAHWDYFEEMASRPIGWGFLAVAFVLCTSAMLLTFGRWYLLVWALGFPFRLRDACRLGFLGYLFNYMAPGSSGGDVVKAIMIAREQTSRRAVAVATVLLDRIVGMVALFIVGSVVALIEWPLVERHEQLKMVALSFWGAGIIGLIGLGVLLWPATTKSRWLGRVMQWKHVGKVVGELVGAVSLYQARPRIIVLSVVLSIVGHLGLLSSFYFCARALHGDGWYPSYASHLLFVPAAEVAGVVVPLPGGVVALEETVGYFYGVVAQASGAPISEAAARSAGFFTAIAFRMLSIVLAAIGGAYYFASRKEIEQALEKTHEADIVGTADA